jgi:zinc/manganese transport system ATP-binding protein
MQQSPTGETAPGPLTPAPLSTGSTCARILELDGVGVRLGGRQVLSDVTFGLGEGEFVGIIGPNGAGKTTLLRVILGLVEPSDGQVRVGGEPLHGKTLPGKDPHRKDQHRKEPHRKSRASIGYVPQKLVIDPDMPLRARDVVSLGLDGHRLGFGLPSRQLADVGAAGYADARVGELSGGEQQRVLIAHALISRPRLLLLDEPLANLDLRSEQEIIAVLGKLSTEHQISVLLSAHDMNPLLGVMNRIVYVANGRAACGPADEVVTSAGLTELYGHQVDVIRVHGRVLVVAG